MSMRVYEHHIAAAMIDALTERVDRFSDIIADLRASRDELEFRVEKLERVAASGEVEMSVEAARRIHGLDDPWEEAKAHAPKLPPGWGMGFPLHDDDETCFLLGPNGDVVRSGDGRTKLFPSRGEAVEHARLWAARMSDARVELF